MQPEFKREVADRFVLDIRIMRREPGIFPGHIRVEGSEHSVVSCDKFFIVGFLVENGARRPFQHLDRTMRHRIPDNRIDLLEQVDRVRIPY